MHAKNFVLGSGYAYFAPAAGGGERYLGDSPSIALNVATEKLAMFDSDTRIAVKVADVVTQITRIATATIRSVTPENLALFIGGSTSTATQTTAAAVSISGVVVQKDRFIQLGNGPGVRNVTSVTVVGTTTTAPVDGVDYILDAALGRIYIPSTTGLLVTETLTITFNRPAVTYSRVTTTDDVGQIGSFRFLSKNTHGEERDMYFPLCKATPEGDLSLKSRDTPQEFTFTIEVLQPEDGSPAVFIDGRPV